VKKPKRARRPRQEPNPKTLGAKPRAAPPSDLEPQKATLVDGAPNGDDWLHELKFDGYRLLASVSGRRVQLITRSGKDWTARMPSLAAELGQLSHDALLDGEITVLDEAGVSSFQRLQHALGSGSEQAIVYYVFDLLYLDGYDLRPLALEQRKTLLSDLLSAGKFGERVRYSDHVVGNGEEFHRAACERGLEGTIAKRRADPYRSGRSPSWLKIKCFGRQEFVVVGFTEPAGSRAHFGALLLGVREGRKWRYAGRVGTGFDDRTLRELKQLMSPLERATPAIVEPPRGAEARGVHWLEPKLVVEVQYTEFTDEGLLRHPSFRGIRRDKAATEVVRERPRR
jgi:bifunctional non-homologous end joining protein LigD